MLNFIQTEGTAHYTGLTTISTPSSLFIKVLGMHMVRFITGILPYVNGPQQLCKAAPILVVHVLGIEKDMADIA
jgi:hypothetical protein